MEARITFEVEQSRKKNRGDEDLFVELKSELPDADRKTARRIAALCNAARGDEVVWIIGIDGKDGTVQGLESTDLQAWWPKIEGFFDEVTPEMRDIIVYVADGQAVIGLFFTTDRAPYVIKQAGGDPTDFEVPWRAATRTRSAKRRELLQILIPAVSLPEIEVLNYEIRATRKPTIPSNTLQRPPSPPKVSVELSVETYFNVHGPVNFPEHRRSGTIKLGELEFDCGVTFDHRRSSTAIIHNPGVAIVTQATRVSINGWLTLSNDLDEDLKATVGQLRDSKTAEFTIKLGVDQVTQPVVIHGELRQTPKAASSEPPPTADVYFEVNHWVPQHHVSLNEAETP